MKIVVYTALFGDKDLLWPVLPVARGDAKYICFSDKPRREVGLWTHVGNRKWPHILGGTGKCCPTTPPSWEVRVVDVLQKEGNRRAARRYKALPHKYLDADVSIWVDANVRLLLPPEVMIDKWLRLSNIATCVHPDRKGAYEEIRACIKMRKDNKAVLLNQEERYRAEGLPIRSGLASTRCVIRRHVPQMKDLNEAWWYEVETYSVRDQISFPFVCWKQGIHWGVIPGFVDRATRAGSNPAFCFIQHGRKRCKAPPCY